MKRVCFVATSPFAVNAFLLGHISALAEIYQVSLCVNLDAYPLAENLDKRVTVFNVLLARKIAVGQDFQALWQLIRIFREGSFDVVHSITPKAGLLAMFAAFLSRIPRRYHTFTGQIWATRQGFARVFFKRIDCLIVMLATRVFSDSASQSRFLESEAVAERGSVLVLGKGSISGVDAARFRPNEAVRRDVRALFSTSEQACVFLFVGRVVKDKGVFDLVRAFDRLSKSESEAELWMVGPDEEGLQKELQQLTAAKSARIRWLGASFEPERFMAAADVLVLPSYREGFGLVIVEAASCGIPAIAYRIDGVIDAIEEGETGLLVDVGDDGKLSNAMLLMLSDPGMRRQFGLQAGERVRHEFSREAITSAWLELYVNDINNPACQA